MLVLVTYDVSTLSNEGRRRLRQVAKTCCGCGQRVQYSVFECQVDEATWARLRGRLLEIIDTREDSIRFYYLGDDGASRREHHGQKTTIDMEGPLLL